MLLIKIRIIMVTIIWGKAIKISSFDEDDNLIFERDPPPYKKSNDSTEGFCNDNAIISLFESIERIFCRNKYRGKFIEALKNIKNSPLPDKRLSYSNHKYRSHRTTITTLS